MAELLPPPPPSSGGGAAQPEPPAQPPAAQSMAPPPMPDPGSWNLLHAEKDGVFVFLGFFSFSVAPTRSSDLAVCDSSLWMTCLSRVTFVTVSGRALSLWHSFRSYLVGCSVAFTQ